MPDFSRLDNLLQNFAEHTVPGCACTVMKNGEICYEGYAGYADRESGKKVDAHSVFRQASTTKLFTYAILGMLYEEGKFLFSDPIADYLPEWKHTQKWVVGSNGEIDIVSLENPITVKDAVSMACGLPYCMFPEANPKNPTVAAMSRQMEKLLAKGTPTLREEVRAMAEAPVMFEPGTRWLYGFGSEIAGAIVEEITAKSLRRVFKERIIEPLNLNDTDTFITEANKEKLVSAYEKIDAGQYKKLPPEADNGIMPAHTPEGARVHLLTSTHDFAVFMQMMANGGVYKGQQLLSKGTIEMLTGNQLNETQLKDFHCDYLAGYGYGMGFRTLMSKAQGFHNGGIGAFGWTGGMGTWVEADPNTGVSIAYMHNMMPNDELYHHHRVRNAAYSCL